MSITLKEYDVSAGNESVRFNFFATDNIPVRVSILELADDCPCRTEETFIQEFRFIRKILNKKSVINK